MVRVAEYYANKRFLVKIVKEVEEDGIFYTMFSEIFVSKGDLILQDEYGNQFPKKRYKFEEEYSRVDKPKKENKVSNFSYDDIVAGYEAMANLDQNEDEEYINEMKDMVSGKPL
jgi:hypothetical protein